MKPEDTPTAIQTTQIDMAVLYKIQEKYDLVFAENARLREALDRAAYALFQIKRMVPEEIPKFAADEHSAACAVLDGEQPFKRSE